MRLLIVGATGGTGAALLAQAIDAGHEVTVVARHPERLRTPSNVAIVEGSVLERGAWEEAVAGQEILLSCLGSTDRKHPTTVYSQGTLNVLNAMGSTSTRRLICLSSGGLDTPPDIPFAQRMVTKLVIQRMYRHGYDDMRRMETLIRAQNVRWTIIRPPMLTDGAPTGGYRTSNNTHLADATSINRSDLAKYMLDAITDQATWRSVVEISR
ncbi:MAG: hypothetical protein JWN09_1710 [Microbacteriaceae bacterium]|nr:hypothetical protein [Microbacteriaceae bacterium]